MRSTLTALLLLAGANCSGSPAANANGPPVIVPPDPNVDVLRLSFVQLGETTKVRFWGPPVLCNLPNTECVKLSAGFPPPPGGPSQVFATVSPSRYTATGTDFASIFFNAFVSAAVTYPPTACPGVVHACVAIDINLGDQNSPANQFVTAIGSTVTLKVNAIATAHINATFAGQFVRYRPGLPPDTVTVLDGYVDAWTSH